jgi:16S rRNA (guanine966-N2)-methyltransferase
VVRSDARAYLRRARRAFDLIFCDPPYRLADRLEGELDSIIGSRLAPGGRLILEGSVRRPLRLDLPLEQERRYGDTLIRIHTGGGA